MEPMISSPMGTLAMVTGIVVLAFFVQYRYQPKLFQYLPPLLWIYVTPLVLSQLGVIPQKSDTYTTLKTYGLPIFLTAMLVEIDMKTAFTTMRSAVGVMLMGSVGVVVGMATGYSLMHQWLSPDAWKGYGALAASWIGGLGNMAAVSEALQTPGPEFGLAVVGDNFGYLLWLPLVLWSKRIAAPFARYSKVTAESVTRMEESQAHLDSKSKEMRMIDIVALLFLGFVVAAVSDLVVPYLVQIPRLGPVLGASGWRVIVLTSIALPVSLTPIRQAVRGNFVMGQAIIYLFVAVMGASADLSGFKQAVPFLAGTTLAMAIHLFFIILGARLFKTDIHTAAIASAANIGAAATAPVVAGYHNEKLVPLSILLALIGYAVGNYGALIAAYWCQWIGG